MLSRAVLKGLAWLSVVLLGVSLSACSRAGEGSGLGDHAAAGPPRFELVEAFRIGDETRADTVVFGYVVGLAVDARGHLFVGDAQVQRVRVFSDDGMFLRALGKKGQGPGEFSRVMSLYAGDSLFVYDLDLRRISVFAPESFEPAYSFTVMEGARETPVGLLGATDEGVLMVYTTPFSAATAEEERFRVVKLLDRQGYVRQDPVLKVPEHEYLVDVVGSSGISVMPLPFGRESILRFGPDNRIYAGWSDAIDVRVHPLDGSAPTAFSHAHEPVPVTGDDVEALLAAIPSERRRERVRNADLPARKPAYETFVVDDRGRFWVKLSAAAGAPTARWLVLQAGGAVVGEAALPAGVRLEVVHAGRAYGIETTEAEAQHVVGYTVREPAPQEAAGGA